MRFIRIAAAFLVVASVGVSFAEQADDQKRARARYAELAAKLGGGDLKIDWQRLRVAAVLSTAGQPSDDFQAVKSGYAALQEGNFEESLKLARKVEADDIADADAHYVAWRSLMGLGREDDAEKERLLLAALMESIMKSGDGESAKTAWFAATIREEYLVIQMMLNDQFEAQRSQKIGDHYYDVVLVKDQSGKEKTLWFNTDTDFQRMQLVTGRYEREHGDPVKSQPHP